MKSKFKPVDNVFISDDILESVCIPISEGNIQKLDYISHVDDGGVNVWTLLSGYTIEENLLTVPTPLLKALI